MTLFSSPNHCLDGTPYVPYFFNDSFHDLVSSTQLIGPTIKLTKKLRVRHSCLYGRNGQYGGWLTTNECVLVLDCFVVEV